MTEGNGLQQKHTRARSARQVGRRYLDQQLEARDSLERQNEEGGEGQPPALGVQLQLCNQLSKGGLLLAGDTDTRAGCWLAGGVNRRCFLPTSQPTGTENASTYLSIYFMEIKLFMYKSNDNSGFTCLAHEDLAKYAVCGKASSSHGQFYESDAQFNDLPSWNLGKVNPRSDRNGQRLETTARGPVLPLPGWPAGGAWGRGLQAGWAVGRATAAEGSRALPLEMSHRPGQHVSSDKDTLPCPQAQAACTHGPHRVSPLGHCSI